MFGKKLGAVKPALALKQTPLPSAAVPNMPPVRPVLHAANPKPMGAEDPQLLEQALLRRMKRFGDS